MHLSKSNEEYWDKIPFTVINQNRSIRSLLPLHKYIKTIIVLFNDNKIDADDIILLKEKIINEDSPLNFVRFFYFLNVREFKIFL